VTPRREKSFCEICRQKIPFGRGEENDFSRRQQALNSHFLPSDKLKIQTQRGQKNFNIKYRLTLRYHFLPLVKMTNG
jgi:hypothetical protein